jgi:hypothetical protein
MSGLIDASGGDGGSALTAPAPLPLPAITPLPPRNTLATPGGGGSGGGVRIQALNFSDAAFATGGTRISIQGGAGGRMNATGTISNPIGSLGGAGGAGLVRLEGLLASPTASAMAPLIAPMDPAVVGADAINVLSIGEWFPERSRPETYSGALSCWMIPTGSFFQILFAEDDPSAVDPDDRFAWDMDVLYAGQVYSYRDPSDSPFVGVSIEQQLGNDFTEGAAGSYVVVRFQGARAVGALPDPCSPNYQTQVVPNSLTPWVRSSEDLNLFSPQPNMVRFCVVFDKARALGAQPGAQIEGITNLRIRTQPD